MIQYRILQAGFFYADGGAMFGAIPRRAWSRRVKCDGQNRCLLSMNCLLVQTRDRIVLLDTGAGSKNLGQLAYYDFQNNRDTRDLVRETGFEPTDVTDVVLSHLHFDHAGGCTYQTKEGEILPAFPNACHYVGKSQWESYLHPNDLEKDSFRREDMMPVYEAGLVSLLDSSAEIAPGFHIDLFDGHTLGQLASRFRSGEETIVFPGDIIPTKAHLSDEWISAYDIEPLKSLEAKRKLKALVKGENTRYVFYHS